MPSSTGSRRSAKSTPSRSPSTPRIGGGAGAGFQGAKSNNHVAGTFPTRPRKGIGSPSFPKPPSFHYRRSRFSLFGLLVRVVLIYAAYIAVFRCPTEDHAICQIRNSLIHMVEPHYQERVQPHIGPYLNQAQYIYVSHVTPLVEKGVHAYQTHLHPYVVSVNDVIWEQHSMYTKPHVDKYTRLVSNTYEQHAKPVVDKAYETYFLPAYKHSQPYVKLAYVKGVPLVQKASQQSYQFFVQHVYPALKRGWHRVLQILQDVVIPHMMRLHRQYVRPQINKIMDKIFENEVTRARKKTTKQQSEKAESVTSTTTSFITPPSVTETKIIQAEKVEKLSSPVTEVKVEMEFVKPTKSADDAPPVTHQTLEPSIDIETDKEFEITETLTDELASSPSSEEEFDDIIDELLKDDGKDDGKGLAEDAEEENVIVEDADSQDTHDHEFASRPEVEDKHAKYMGEIREKITLERTAFLHRIMGIRKDTFDIQLKELNTRLENFRTKTKKLVRSLGKLVKKLAKNRDLSTEDKLTDFRLGLRRVAENVKSDARGILDSIPMTRVSLLDTLLAEARSVSDPIETLCYNYQGIMGAYYESLEGVTVEDWDEFHKYRHMATEVQARFKSLAEGRIPPIGEVTSEEASYLQKYQEDNFNFERMLSEIEQDVNGLYAEAGRTLKSNKDKIIEMIKSGSIPDDFTLGDLEKDQCNGHVHNIGAKSGTEKNNGRDPIQDTPRDSDASQGRRVKKEKEKKPAKDLTREGAERNRPSLSKEGTSSQDEGGNVEVRDRSAEERDAKKSSVEALASRIRQKDEVKNVRETHSSRPKDNERDIRIGNDKFGQHEEL